MNQKLAPLFLLAGIICMANCQILTDKLSGKTKITFSLTENEKTQYYTNINLGSPVQEVPIIFKTDNESSQIICCQTCSMHTRNHHFAFKYSSSFKFDKKDDKGKDIFTIPQNATFNDTVSLEFQMYLWDGVNDDHSISWISLDLGSYLQKHNQSFLYQLISTGIIEDPIVSIFYDTKENSSQITFGGSNPKHSNGDLKWAKALNNKWQFQINSALVDGAAYTLKEDKIKLFTDLSVIGFPETDFWNIFAEIDKKYPCDFTDYPGFCMVSKEDYYAFPTINFIVKGSRHNEDLEFTLDPLNYVTFEKETNSHNKYYAWLSIAHFPDEAWMLGIKAFPEQKKSCP